MDPFKAQQTGLQAPWGEGPLSFLLSSWTWAQYRDTINPDKSEGRTRTTELALEKLPCLIYLASMWMQWHYVVFSPQDQLQQDKKKKKITCILAHFSFWFILQSRMSHCSKWPRNFRNIFFFLRKRNSTVAKCTPYHISRVWETGISQLKVICSNVYLS